MNDNIKAIVTLIEYKTEKYNSFYPIKEVTLNNDQINLSIILTIEMKKLDNEQFYLYLIHTSKGLSIEVAVAKLKEFNVGESFKDEPIKVVETQIGELAYTRYDSKMNFTSIPTLGEGNYIIALSHLSEKRARASLKNFIDSIIAAYPFKVIRG